MHKPAPFCRVKCNIRKSACSMLTMGPPQSSQWPVYSCILLLYILQYYCTHKAGLPLRLTMFQPTPTLMHIHLFSAFHKQAHHTKQGFSFLEFLNIKPTSPHLLTATVLLMWGHFLNSCCVCFIFLEKHYELCLHTFF